MIVYAGIQANMPIYTAIFLINILLGFAYYLRLIKIIVWSTPNKKLNGIKDAPLLILVPILVLTLACILIGVYPAPFIEIASRAVKALTGSF